MRTFDRWIEGHKDIELSAQEIDQMRAAWNAALYSCAFRGWVSEDGTNFTTSPAVRRDLLAGGVESDPVYIIAPLSLVTQGI